MSRPDRAAGLSLVEVCGATVVVGLVTAVALSTVPRWLDSAEQSATTTSLTSVLQDTQRRAVGEGKAMCVAVDQPAQTWTVVTGRCRPPRDGVTFFGDGTATPRTVQLGADMIAVDSSGHVTRR